ncbi:hypothetical protein [Streptomyces sp. HD]|uniref:hypothetical protein n=1 Tax=Streptomyces sp. HD TaxID=3020892 RepID=UPI00232E6565|nr:hypothetical protein [Streptomyces sp. HD]MDC0771705.1 hypothetical protein [Streptomyces sp. HD]
MAGAPVGGLRVALVRALARPGVTSVIVGAKRPDQLTENPAAGHLVPTDEDLAQLEPVSGGA